MTLTLVRLAFAGLRSRLLATVLTVLLAAAAAGTVVLVLEVRETGRDPWERTFAAAHGAHVLANVPTQGAAEALRSLDGVTESADPVPTTALELVTASGTEPLRVAGLSGTPTVNRPIATSGTADPGAGVVLERSFARVEGLETGMVGLNRGVVSDPAAPFGGVKQSGIGREGGHHGLLEFLEPKYFAFD